MRRWKTGIDGTVILFVINKLYKEKQDYISTYEITKYLIENNIPFKKSKSSKRIGQMIKQMYYEDLIDIKNIIIDVNWTYRKKYKTNGYKLTYYAEQYINKMKEFVNEDGVLNGK